MLFKKHTVLLCILVHVFFSISEAKNVLPMHIMGSYYGKLELKNNAFVMMRLDIYPETDSSASFTISYIDSTGKKDVRPYTLKVSGDRIYLDKNNNIELDLFYTQKGFGCLYSIDLAKYLIYYDFTQDECSFSLHYFGESGFFENQYEENTSIIQSFQILSVQTAILEKIKPRNHD